MTVSLGLSVLHALTVLLAPGDTSVNVCDHGGKQIVTAWNTLLSIGKYLVGTALMLGAGIWLISEFFAQDGRGGFKVSTFLFHHIVPLAIFILAVGLLLGFIVTDGGILKVGTGCPGA